MSKRLAAHLSALLLAALPLAAFAHTGHGNQGFIDGFAHPFLGLDHLLAMLLVGVWSVVNARQTRDVWPAPAVFMGFLAGGALLGQHGIVLPQLEPLVAASVLALGAMLALPSRMSVPTSLAFIGGFALFHGMAHGGELSADSSTLAGILLGSALLHGTGMAVAHFVLAKRPRLAQRVGRMTALVGGGLLLSSVL